MQPTDHDLLIRISEQINGLDVRFGALDTRLDRLDARLDAIVGRVVKLENWRWYVIGVSSASGMLIGYYVGTLL